MRRVYWNNSDFMNLYTKFALCTYGCLLRNTPFGRSTGRDEVETVIAVYYSRNDPVEYMLYLIKEDIMHNKEMIYFNR